MRTGKATDGVLVGETDGVGDVEEDSETVGVVDGVHDIVGD